MSGIRTRGASNFSLGSPLFGPGEPLVAGLIRGSEGGGPGAAPSLRSAPG